MSDIDWHDVTTIGSLYEVEYQPFTGDYRHREAIVRSIFDFSEDNREWLAGLPPETK